MDKNFKQLFKIILANFVPSQMFNRSHPENALLLYIKITL